jgi:hypothetical protein
MHSAPSVSYPVGRCRFAGGLMLLAWLCGALVLAAWSWQMQAAGWRAALGGATLVLAGAAAAFSWRRSPTGLIAWDGATWRWADGAGERSGTVFVALDLQQRLLLHWRPEHGAALWLWLEQLREPQAWDALRRAVYSRAKADAPSGA